MTDEELQAIRERAEKASAGPWEVCGTPNEPWRRIGNDYGCIDVYMQRLLNGDNNAEFIANARTDIPALLEEVLRLRKAILSFGTGNDFDWNILHKLDEQEEIERLRAELDHWKSKS